ncbi:hypothetical protein A6A19_02790 [Actinobacillus delphinicola]|uniref:Fatty acid metabolism regulator n=1 Tax=Actinobacillus delphinicola TaxID=51161 RepID=A0A448TRW6_9PAST|nr:fatty acid metabolism transcriptional regulator FadR [Actinobacillus delphinicola]MDG6896951.1 hypothetical protein [Actinobacillus delphinicola]VEJ08767.1 fatty acid metabolism regulator [Actinobacillus delphinicola]
MKKYQFDLVAQSPAKLAEEYIVKSIWYKNLLPGECLPAERELAEKIGVTRTTLREVLQRLARDGWLTIQHGKPTKVNDIWHTAGPAIVQTLLTLDKDLAPLIVENVVTLRTEVMNYYIPHAVQHYHQSAKNVFAKLTIPTLQDDAQTFAEFDFQLCREFAFADEKPVYALILNSFHTIYQRVASFYFTSFGNRQNAVHIYTLLKVECENGNVEKVRQILRELQEYSYRTWSEMLKNITPDNNIDYQYFA